MTIGVLVLAAGFSRRFGRDKRFYEIKPGKPLLQATLLAVIDAGLPCRVCIRAGDADLETLLARLDVEVLRCRNAELGIGATLAEGVGRCDDWEGLLVALGDMAWVRPATYGLLEQSLSPNWMVQPSYQNRPGNPIGFGRDFYKRLRTLQGDRGGRKILEENPDAVYTIPVQDAGIHRDLDRPGAENDGKSQIYIS